ncbi:MAG TPA: hypothetical protein VFW96_05655, partial [Thermomicrobiales bacterium]|nr:hypothetical protein [Thermomicrobiales bacterium]
GCLLPLGPVMRHVDERPTDPLVVRVAPAGDAALELPEADGSLTRLALTADGPRRVTLAIDGAVARHYELQVHAPAAPDDAPRAAVDGFPIAARRDGATIVARTPAMRAGDVELAW